MLLGIAAGTGRSARAEVPGAWVGDLMLRLAAIPERHESFREEKRLAALEQPLISEGRLVYRRPAHLEKITRAPVPEILVVDDDDLTLSGQDGSPRRFALGNRPEIAALVDAVRGTLSGDLGRLKRYYQVHAGGDPGSWQLVLRPTNPRVQDLLREVVVAGAGTYVSSFRVEQANGDTQIMTIEAVPPVPLVPPPVASAAPAGSPKGASGPAPRRAVPTGTAPTGTAPGRTAPHGSAP